MTIAFNKVHTTLNALLLYATSLMTSSIHFPYTITW